MISPYNNFDVLIFAVAAKAKAFAGKERFAKELRTNIHFLNLLLRYSI